MNISDLIKVLSRIQNQYGDLLVTNLDSEPNDGDDPGYAIELQFDTDVIDLVLGLTQPVIVRDYKILDDFFKITGIKPARLNIVSSSSDLYIAPFPERKEI